MSGVKGKGPIFNPGLCRCCGNMKKCRVLNLEYESCGQKEVYSDMIMDCFGLLLSHLDGSPSERLICAVCVSRIRDALKFRRQVLQCEEAFLGMKTYDAKIELNAGDPNMADVLMEPHVKSSLTEVEIVKLEPSDAMDMDDRSEAGDVLGDTMDDDQKPEVTHNRNSKDDIKPQVLISEKDTRNCDAAILANQMLITKRNIAAKLKRKLRCPIGSIKRPVTDATDSYETPIKTANTEAKEEEMLKLQQQMREKDPSYKREINILSVLEYSYVCPFKCRHNNLLCYYCGEIFSDPVLLREHTLKNHHPKKFKVTEHRSMIKVDLTRIDCRLCNVKIDNLDDFRSHIIGTHGKKYYFDVRDSVLPFKLTRNDMKCAICNIFFPYFHALNKHMNSHFSNYVCETCGLGFVDHGRFVMHLQRHEEGEFPCPTCGKVFKAQYNRDLHVDRVHRKKGRVYCPKCDVKLMSYPQKLKHLVEVHGEEPLTFPCETCERVFDSRRILTIHKRKEHLKDYRYECQCCGQKFFTRFALNNHMPTHTGERNFKCKVCEKSYPRLKTLKDHMRIHTNDRRYRCHVCGQAFIQNCSLKGHMKSQHPEYG